MPMLRLYRFAACVCLLLSVGTTFADAPVIWKFEQGQAYRYQLLQTTKNEISAGDAGVIKTDTRQVIDMVWTVESVNDDGSAKIVTNVERVQMQMNAPMAQGFDYDTASEDPPQGLATLLSPTFRALVEHGYSMTMNPAGEIGQVEASEEVLEAFKRLPGASTIEALVMPVSAPLPKGEVEVGAEWSQPTGDTSIPIFGKMTVLGNFRYEGTKADSPGTVLITPSLTANATAPEGGPLTGSIKTKESSGAILFNREVGRLESSTLNHTMTIDMTAGDKTISGTIQQSIAFTFGAKSEPLTGSTEASSAE